MSVIQISRRHVECRQKQCHSIALRLTLAGLSGLSANQRAVNTSHASDPWQPGFLMLDAGKGGQPLLVSRHASSAAVSLAPALDIEAVQQ